MTNVEMHIDTIKKLIPEINDYMDLHSYEREALQVAIKALQEKHTNKLLENACQLVGQEFNCSYNYVVKCLKAQAERDNPQPLTLEQLKERVGKPVWCSKNKQYGIISKSDDTFEVWSCGGWESLEYFMTKPIYDYEPKGI